MIDDLITTGESVIETAEVIRDQGGVVNELVVLFGPGARGAAKAPVIPDRTSCFV